MPQVAIHAAYSSIVSDDSSLGDTAFSSGFGLIVNAAIILDGRPSLSTGEQVAVSIGITFIWALQNALRIDQQGWLNNLAAFFQIASSIVIVVVLFVMAPQRADAHDVFFATYNGTGFPFGYVYCISILSTLFSFSGYEGNRTRLGRSICFNFRSILAGAHLAEETRGAGRAGKQALLLSFPIE